MANQWVEFVKEYQKKTGLPYKEALLEAKQHYTPSKEKKQNTSKAKIQQHTPMTETKINSQKPGKKTKKIIKKIREETEEEIEGGRINFKKIGRSIRKAARPIARASKPIIREVGREVRRGVENHARNVGAEVLKSGSDMVINRVGALAGVNPELTEGLNSRINRGIDKGIKGGSVPRLRNGDIVKSVSETTKQMRRAKKIEGGSFLQY